MPFYIRPVGTTFHVWKIDDGVAILAGVANPEGGVVPFFKAAPGENIWDALRRQATGWFGPNGESPFVELTRQPGEYYPRMARPISAYPQEAPGHSPCVRTEENLIAISRSQLSRLTQQLERICQTVHPSAQTFDAFGHDVRNLLILTCTEVENHWRGVLRSNGVIRHRYTTNDYLQLRAAMRLDEYAVSVVDYPWLESFRPFQGWGATGKPTEDLEWYDAYNAIKHDREGNFHRAKLRHAFDALSAVVVLMAAQFGEPHGLGHDLRRTFRFEAVPAWPLSEVYTYAYDEDGRSERPVNYPF